MSDTNEHFQFMHYKKCFERFEERSKTEDVRLIIDDHWCTSGYWIEPLNSKRTNSEVASYTKEDFPSFKKRVEQGILARENGEITAPKGLIL